jgi:hypothetical protein
MQEGEAQATLIGEAPVHPAPDYSMLAAHAHVTLHPHVMARGHRGWEPTS